VIIDFSKSITIIDVNVNVTFIVIIVAFIVSFIVIEAVDVKMIISFVFDDFIFVRVISIVLIG
jgi:hypothetical protein